MKDRTPTFFLVLFTLIAGLTSFTITAQDLSLYVTGWNTDGQLGLGDNTGRNTFTPVTLPEGVSLSQVAAGSRFSLMLTGNGELYATGQNNDGQLGLGNNMARNTFTLATLPGGRSVARAEAGYYFSLIVTEDGELYVTGDNDDGQLGLGGNTDRNTFTPVTLPGGTSVAKVAAGAYHSLIVNEDGELYATGENFFGQLGLGDNMDRNTFTSVALPGGKRVSQVVAGYYHSLILTTDGELYATGWNDDGKLGLGNTTDQNTFTQVPLPEGKRVSQVVAGGFHSMLVTEDGELYGTGWNALGLLGLGDTTNRLSYTQVPLPEGKSVLQVVGGYLHNLILTEDRELYAIGGNSDGQLGLGDNTARNTYELVEVGSGGQVVQITAGMGCSMVIASIPSILVSGFPSSIETGESIAATLTAKAFTGTVTYTLSGNVPDGLSIVGDQIVGSPMVDGYYSFRVTGTNGVFSASKALHLTVSAIPVPVPNPIEETRSYDICTNTFSYRYYPLNEEGTIAEPYEYEVIGSLPEGLKIEDGMLQGVVANTGTYAFTIVLTSGVDQLTLYYTMRGVPPTLQPTFCGVWLNGVYSTLSVVEESTHVTPAVTELYNAVVSTGVPLMMSFEWDCIKESQGYIIAGGALPEGLNQDGTTGVISGTPSAPGEYIFVVSVKDWRGRAYQWVRLVVE